MAKPDKKKEALILLSQGISQTRVSELVGVDRRTIVRWLKLPKFKEQLLTNRKSRLEAVLEEFVPHPPKGENKSTGEEPIKATSPVDELTSKALAALSEILSNPESRNADRLKACQLILQLVGGNRIEGIGQASTPLPSTSGDRDSEIDRLIAKRELLKAQKARLEVQKSH